MKIEKVVLQTDLLIIGGGTAGCYAGIKIAEESNRNVIIAEKANIKRSGCLAAGVNALNAYIVKGNTPEDYLDYVKKDANGLIREDLVLTMSEGLNRVTHHLEKLGLVILKDDKGEYVTRGNRNIKINGENIKPILAKAVESHGQIKVLNKVNIVDYIVVDNRIQGAYGFGIEENKFYVIYANAVICATGGAAGIYKPNNPGFSKHKMWYPPFNTGGGYAMGIRSGAEMTTFEMRFIALRCKDTIAPTGTIAQGVMAPQINSLGEFYYKNYGAPTTPNRVYSTIEENKQGRGPCFLKTKGIGKEAEDELLKAYLNMAPAQTLKWLESGGGPNEKNVEIEGTEPYIVGGHTSSGYWVATNRETTIKGLYAAGDVAGGCPQKYVTGSLVEGEIAAKSALEYIKELEELKDLRDLEGLKGLEDLKGIKELEEWRDIKDLNSLKSKGIDSYNHVRMIIKNNSNINNFGCRSKSITENKKDEDIKMKEITKYLNQPLSTYTIEDLEDAMQKVMDQYAGGISSNYGYNQVKLQIAEQRIQELQRLTDQLKAEDAFELMRVHELKDRLLVALVVITHLNARKETRWHSFQENLDYPEVNDKDFFIYINSTMKDNSIQIVKREFVDRRQVYEHNN